MENQHRKITGYRDLSAEEVALMNEIKELGPQIEATIIKVQQHVNKQRMKALYGQEDFKPLPKTAVDPLDPETLKRLEDATPERFAAMAKTEFQTGLMYLVRAVAQPTSF
ncbi:DUF7681 family protein [Acinetobacter sp. 243_ASPC]|uniref:Acb2/Tad1 domain-containing protein n=1 Tax=Acinetobacter sp. 243_ASPC TaxID=1579345 RepID=UPI000660A2F1|nr:hypothetical protein [Acinetobacter sp. 243_ASPC]